MHKIRTLQQQVEPMSTEIEYKLIQVKNVNQDKISHIMGYGSIYQLLKYLKIDSVKEGHMISFKGKELYDSGTSYDKTYNIFFWQCPIDRSRPAETRMLNVWADFGFLKRYFKGKSSYEIKQLYAPALDQDYELYTDDYE